MNTYRYEGLSSSGAKVEGVVEAVNEQEAIARAKASCRVVTKVTREAQKNLFNTDLGELLGGGKIKAKALSLLCSQLAIELKAGLPIVRSLQLVAENEADKNLKRILEKTAEDVGAGHGLADSFESNGPMLPSTFIETVRAGEESGTLELCFSRLYTYFDKSAKTKAKVASALTYPIMVIVVAIIVFIIVMVKAVPAFTTAFRDLGTDLPSITKGMIAVSDFMIEKWWAMALIAMAIAAACVLVKRDPRGRCCNA